jgi:putative hemolysin
MEGVGEASESAIITGVVAFGLLKARDVMTPRSEIVAVDRALSAEGVIRLMAQSKYSRVPVYVGDLDHCVGLVHSFDVLAHPDTPLDAPRRLSQWSADTPAQEILRRMLRERVHLAIIQDATGATVGLVTLEDLVEELVGDISDEHDEPQGQLS